MIDWERYPRAQLPSLMSSYYDSRLFLVCVMLHLEEAGDLADAECLMKHIVKHFPAYS